jgi:putative DNA primase/helicase
MTVSENPLQHNIREYAIEGLDRRHHFESPSYRSTLLGKSQTFESVFLHSEKLKDYCEAKRLETGKPSITGYRDTVGADCVSIDIDSQTDLEQARQATIHIIENLCTDFLVDPLCLTICFSGNKGFHISVPAGLFGGFTPSKDLPRFHKMIVEQLAGEYSYLVDYTIYGHVSIIRLENTRHEKSGLFAVPLIFSELQEHTVDDIKIMAVNIRTDVKRIDSSTLQANQKLVALKASLEDKLSTAPVSTVDENNVYSYSNVEFNRWNRIAKHCKVLQQIEQKGKTGELIRHDDRVALGCIATAFGDDGKKKVHDILKTQSNYDKNRTEYYLDTMADSGYKPKLCEKICGPDNLCDAIKVINRRSPIAFAYTHDANSDTPKKYVESYAVEKLRSHFTNLLYVTKEKVFYQYDHGVYKMIDAEALKARICEFLPYYFPAREITHNRMNALEERMKLERSVRFEGTMNADTHKINLQNGIFDLQTGKLSAHDPNIKLSVQIPSSYDPRATCPLFDKFMEETFKNDKETIEYVLKLWCYLLLPTYAFQKIWVWLGEGRNGKGVLSRLMIRMLGQENVSHEDIHQLAHERFSSINLKDKLANISTELRADDLDMSALKKLSGEDYISAEFKGKDKIAFKSFARLIIIANQLPRFSEIGTAIMERFEFIRFENVVTNAAVDTTLEEKLAKELPGIFNRVVLQFSQIVGADGRIYFETPTKLKEAQKEVLSDLSSVVEFVETDCVKGRELQMQLKDLYAKYKQWSKDCGYKPLGRNRFSNLLRNACKLEVSGGTGNQTTVKGVWTEAATSWNLTN